jgi:hypothetical protein
MLQAHAPVVVSPCETAAERADAVARVVAEIVAHSGTEPPSPAAMPDGAAEAADEILALIGRDAP